MRLLLIFLVSLSFGFGIPQQVNAIPAPDFLMAVGSQFAQIFSLVVVLVSAAAASVIQVIRVSKWNALLRPRVAIPILLVLLGISAGFAWNIDQQQQTIVLQEMEAKVTQDISNAIEERDAFQTEAPTMQEDYSLSENPDVRFIASYYSALNEHRVADAYAVSAKTVSAEVYSSWYADVTSVILHRVSISSERTYSVDVSTFASNSETRYAVLMTIGDGVIQSSSVRVLSADEASLLAEGTEGTTDFSTHNSTIPLSISNGDFAAIEPTLPFVLDAREDEEVDLGHYPNSTHIRFADLLAGAWVSLPTDQVVYVLCWSGIRGSEVANFLREKGIVARYLAEGADGWVTSGGQWEGEIKFVTKYPEERYTSTVSDEEMRAAVNLGAVLIDSRDASHRAKKPINGAIPITAFFTPTVDLAAALALVPANVDVITVCDDFVSCFDAKIVGIRLENLGHVFLGRYVQY